MPLYSTCSVSQRCKKTRAILPFGGRFVAEIFVQNFKWRVSQRGADVSYFDFDCIQLLLHLFSGYPFKNIAELYLLSVTALQKDEGYTSLRRPFCSRNIRPKFHDGCSERGRRYILPTFVIVSQKLAELYSLT